MQLIQVAELSSCVTYLLLTVLISQAEAIKLAPCKIPRPEIISNRYETVYIYKATDRYKVFLVDVLLNCAAFL